jgi:hypothetical protein
MLQPSLLLSLFDYLSPLDWSRLVLLWWVRRVVA